MSELDKMLKGIGADIGIFELLASRHQNLDEEDQFIFVLKAESILDTLETKKALKDKRKATA